MDAEQRIGYILQEEGYREYRGNSPAETVYVRAEQRTICAVEVISVTCEGKAEEISAPEEERGRQAQRDDQESRNRQSTADTAWGTASDTAHDTAAELAQRFQCNKEDVHLLRLLVCGYVTKSLREEGDPFCWIIDKSTNRLLIYEDRAPDFYGLRRVIEHGLAEEEMPPSGYGQTKEMISADSRNMYGEIREQLRKIPVTAALVIVNVVLFLLCAFWPAAAVILYGLGMLQAPAVLQQGEYWRVITSMFLHADTAHLFSNMIMLLFVGESIERIMGSRYYLLLYLLSGVLGNVFSMTLDVMQGASSMSLGASGAVFGVMGAMLLLVLVQRRRLQKEVVFRVALGVGCCLYNGFVTAGINNAAHVGGMVGGLICCGIWLLYNKKWR